MPQNGTERNMAAAVRLGSSELVLIGGTDSTLASPLKSVDILNPEGTEWSTGTSRRIAVCSVSEVSGRVAGQGLRSASVGAVVGLLSVLLAR